MNKHKNSIGVFLETAHPIKFLDVIEPALNIKLPIPKQIESVLGKEKISVKIKSYEELKEILQTEDVAVIIDAKHLCVSSRGIKDETSSTVTSYFGGKFNTQEKIVELQNTLKY